LVVIGAEVWYDIAQEVVTRHGALATYLRIWPSHSQLSQGEQLLDGTSLNYQYQNGSAVHAEFVKGQYKYLWTAGPFKGLKGKEKYQSKKIGDKLYMF
jgi:hypothetical protein